MTSVRKFRKSPKLRRRSWTKTPKIELWVVCEGRRTEPDYLNKFCNHHGNGLVKINTISGVGVPFTIVEEAKRVKKDLLKKAKRSKDSFAMAFEVWGMFDVDQHPRIGDAKYMARDNGIFLCISNPCIELWAILHIEDQNACIHRHNAQRKLSKIMPSYCHSGNPIFDYSSMRDTYELAKGRAVNLNKKRRKEETPDGNPSTNAYELLDKVINNAK